MRLFLYQGTCIQLIILLFNTSFDSNIFEGTEAIKAYEKISVTKLEYGGIETETAARTHQFKVSQPKV